MEVKKLEERLKKKGDGGLKYVDTIENHMNYDFGLDDIFYNEKISGGEKLKNLRIIEDLNNDNIYIVDKDDVGKFVSDNILTDVPDKEYLLENWKYRKDNERSNTNKSDKMVSVKIKGDTKKLKKYTLEDLGITIDSLKKMNYRINFDNGISVVRDKAIEGSNSDRVASIWSMVITLNSYGYIYMPADIGFKEFRTLFIKSLYGKEKSIDKFLDLLGITDKEIYNMTFDDKLLGRVKKSA